MRTAIYRMLAFLWAIVGAGLVATANATVTEHGTVDPSAVNLMMVAVSALATAIVFLFFWFRSEFSKCASERETCHAEHIKLLERIARLEK